MGVSGLELLEEVGRERGLGLRFHTPVDSKIPRWVRRGLQNNSDRTLAVLSNFTPLCFYSGVGNSANVFSSFVVSRYRQLEIACDVLSLANSVRVASSSIVLTSAPKASENFVRYSSISSNKSVKNLDDIPCTYNLADVS